MEQSNKKKVMLLSIIGIIVLVVVVLGVSFAFFSYSRTGNANTISTGTINFNSTNTLINLQSAFPVSATTAYNTSSQTANVGIATVNITGQTNYPGGVDFVVSAVNVSSNIGTSAGKLPVKVLVSGSSMPAGTSYLTTGSTAVLVSEDAVLASGTIPGDNTAVNGTITIKAFIDDTNLLVTDTASGGAIAVDGYTNNVDTTGKTVLTTSEWNALNSAPASFKIKVESQEHTA